MTPPPPDPLDRFTRVRTGPPGLWVFMCGCKRIVRKDGPKIAMCKDPTPSSPCLDSNGRGHLATDDELRAEGLDPEDW